MIHSERSVVKRHHGSGARHSGASDFTGVSHIRDVGSDGSVMHFFFDGVADNHRNCEPMLDIRLTTNVEQPPFDCRRHAERIPYPVDVEFHVGHRILTGVVRDISVDHSSRPERIGIAVLHYAELPTGHPVLCLTNQATERLPQQFDVVFKWTRRFGDDGFLSGGLLV